MLQRVDAMEAELGALIESLRTGANRLQADLTLLEGNMGELYGAAAGRPARQRRRRARRGRPRPPPRRGSGVADAPAGPPGAARAARAAPALDDGDADIEGARLIALNMALNGTARDETDRYLAENFDLSDRSGLLDEVYASVEG